MLGDQRSRVRAREPLAGSIFGNLATVYITIHYVSLSAIVYVSGLVVDLLAARSRNDADGARQDARLSATTNRYS
jgi:hypothetical protein